MSPDLCLSSNALPGALCTFFKLLQLKTENKLCTAVAAGMVGKDTLMLFVQPQRHPDTKSTGVTEYQTSIRAFSAQNSGIKKLNVS
jgi:hypothetical protein